MASRCPWRPTFAALISLLDLGLGQVLATAYFLIGLAPRGNGLTARGNFDLPVYSVWARNELQVRRHWLFLLSRSATCRNSDPIPASQSSTIDRR